MTLRKTLGISALIVGLAAVAAPTATAICFDVNSLVPVAGSGNDWNEVPPIGTKLYKADAPSGPEDGSGASYFTTTFTLDEGEVVSGFVDFDIPGSELDLEYFVIKAGNGYHKYDISGIDFSGYTCIEFEKVGKQAISHISIYGRRGTVVPDGGSVALMLGAGLLALGALRRR